MKRANQKVYGFAHTSKEILQQIDHLEGRSLPPELEPFMTDWIGASKGDIDSASDLYLVEISTTKEIHFRDWLFQVNYVERSFKNVAPLLALFKKKSRPTDRAERRRLLESHPLFAEASELQRQILLEAYIHMTTPAELEADLAEIKRRLPAPVVFVCHIDVDDLSGRVLKSRRELCGWMRSICAEKGHTLLDPTPHALEYGRKEALEESGRDVNHYTNEYKYHYGCMLFDQYCAPLVINKSIGAKSELAQETPKNATANRPDRVPPDRVWGFIRGKGEMAAGNEPGSSVEIDVARQHLGRGDLDAAEASLGGASASADARNLLGQIAARRGDPQAAEGHLRAALAADPLAVEPKVHLVRLLLADGRAEEAGPFAPELVEEAPRDVRALGLAAKVFGKLRQFGDAAEASLLAAEAQPSDPANLVEAARYLNKAKLHERAAEAADLVLARTPEHGAALAQKVEALAKLKRPAELGPALLAVAPSAPDLALRHLPTIVSAEEPHLAAAILAAARAAGGEGSDAPEIQDRLVRQLGKLGKTASQAEDVPEAVRAWTALRLIEPESKQALLGVRNAITPHVAEGRRLAGLEDVAGAAAAYRQALTFDPTNARVLRELASVLEKGKDWPAATEVWQGLSDLPDAAPDTLARGARCARQGQLYESALGFYARMGEEERAEAGEAVTSVSKRLVSAMREDFKAEAYDAAIAKALSLLSIDPEHEQAQRYVQKATSVLVRLMRDMNRSDVEREAIARKIISLNPDHAEAWRLYGKLSPEGKRELQKRKKQLESA